MSSDYLNWSARCVWRVSTDEEESSGHVPHSFRSPEDAEQLAQIIFAETTTIGVRLRGRSGEYWQPVGSRLHAVGHGADEVGS